MAFYNSPVRERAAKATDAVLALLVILLVLQVWLLSASVELWLAGHHEVAVPAAAVSGLLFAGGAGLMILMRRTERRARSSSGD
jgi:nitrate reductase gamma subunit